MPDTVQGRARRVISVLVKERLPSLLSLFFALVTKNGSAYATLGQQQLSSSPVGTCSKMRVLWPSYALYAKGWELLKPGHPSLLSILRVPHLLHTRPKPIRAAFSSLLPLLSLDHHSQSRVWPRK
ncbi:hypothetical protein NEUTE2DRAFT_69794 [Neurospora tetrasperma FGSC 2509]|nr:hypothetical protein NEUTE2DRAFT_69794 [Neurospora tetrasperma FGSC 2509]